MWRDDLAALDESWAAMRAAHDAGRLRYRAFIACVFAITSVHTPVSRAEWEFESYMSEGSLPDDGTMLGNTKCAAILSLIEWIADTTADTFDVDGWTLAETIMRHVNGLGPAKSAFASALCGNPEPYCLDTHSVHLIADRTGEDYHRIIGSIQGHGTRRMASILRRYHRWGDTTYGSRDHQWEYFALANAAFGEGGHAIYFAKARLLLTMGTSFTMSAS